MQHPFLTLAIYTALFLAVPARAAMLTYHFAGHGNANDRAGIDLGGDGDAGETQIAEGQTGSTTVSSAGVTVTLHATPHISGTATGHFNYNYDDSGNFGIDRNTADEPDAFEYAAGDGSESMEFWFDRPGTLHSIDFDRFDLDDAASLSFDGGTTLSFDGSQLDATDLLASINIPFAANQRLTLTPQAGTDYFGLERLTITAIPEPDTLIFLSLFTAIAARLLSHRRRHE